MAENVEKDVKFITSLAMAVLDKDGETRHIQIVIAQEDESGLFRCYFDVVDPSKVKLADDTVSRSEDN